MSFHRWLQNLRSALVPGPSQGRRRQRRSPRAASNRPSFEVLEDRCVPAQYPYAMVTADFNGDGLLDWAMPNPDTNDVTVYLSNGGAHNYATGEFPDTIAAGDFNNDGRIDLVTGMSGDDGAVSVLLGNGDGSFQSPRYSFWNTGYWDGEAIYDIAVHDLNADGNLDLAVSLQGHIYVLMGHGQGYFGLSTTFRTSSCSTAPSVVAADFNRDGQADLAWSNWDTAVVDVALNNGQGCFQPVQSYATANQFWELTVADSNGDGNLDLVSEDNVLLGNGDGTFQDPLLPLSLRINDVTVTEGNTGTASATFTVTLSAASTQTVTVAYATGNDTASAGSDYQSATGTLTFAAGERSKTVTVPVIGDRLGEPNETFFDNLSSPTNATIADGQGVGTIVDDEPRISISDVTKAEGTNGQTTLFTFTVTLSAAYDQAVTMSFQTVNGTAKANQGDYIARTGTLTFAPGETTKTITIEVKGDTKTEANETFYLDLFGNNGNSLFTKNRGVGTILNDD
jgi:Calx-beta domain-containing protein/VCBS repeat protein